MYQVGSKAFGNKEIEKRLLDTYVHQLIDLSLKYTSQ